MTTNEMIEKLRYKANNIKAHIEPEFFNDVADVLEKYQWIDVKDRLPTNDEDVLVYMEDGKERRVVLGWYWWEEWHTYDENYLDDDYEVVAWMPLPEYKKEV